MLEAITIEEAGAWYADADPVHDIDHVMRVYRLSERIARDEGADLEIVRAAALLHDSKGSAPGTEGSARAEHHITSALYAREILSKKRWPEDKILAVQHCIRAHRFRGDAEPPQTLEAQVLFDADKLDVLGAIGAARTIAYAALDNQPTYAEPSPQFIQTGIKQSGEPHSSYHEFLFKLQHVKERMFTKTGKYLAEARHNYLVNFYQQLQAESRGER
jgi:uncharacterized protein